MDEVKESRAYSAFVEKAVAESPDSFCSFRKEKQMDYLFRHLKKDFAEKNQKVLDICGGYGRLLHFLQELDGQQEYYCLDQSEALVRMARERFAGLDNIHCEVADLYALAGDYQKKFDVTILYKTLYMLPYYRKPIEELVKVTKKKIYITSPFFEGDIDFLTKIYPDASGDDEGNFAYCSIYSMPKFTAYCESLGVKQVDFEPMPIDFDLPAPADKNVLQTRTELTANGERLEICGTVVLNWKLVTLTL